MYYEVYLDVLFVENLWMNGMLLLMTGWSGRMQIRLWRLLAAACAGSIGACAMTLLTPWLNGAGYFLGTLLLAVCMAGMAFPVRKDFFRGLLNLYLESFLLNGLLRYLEQFHPMAGIWFGLVSGGSFLVLTGLEQVRARMEKKHEILYPVTLFWGSESLSLEALYDTGNSLYDPISHKPVSILSEELFQVLRKKSGRETVPRMIPYHTISESGVLEAYMLDKMEIRCSGATRVFLRPLLAPVPEKNRQYQLILHRDMLPS